MILPGIRLIRPILLATVMFALSSGETPSSKYVFNVTVASFTNKFLVRTFALVNPSPLKIPKLLTQSISISYQFVSLDLSGNSSKY